MKLHLPEKFINTVPYVEYDAEGKRCYRSKRVESPTGAISISFSGPLGQSYSEKALENKKVLQIRPGETLDFTEEEGEFLLGRYPFLEKSDVAIESQAPEVQSLGVATTSSTSSGPAAIDMAKAPTNFMQFKKWAAENGATVEKSDTIESLKEKLLSINQSKNGSL